ncbi:MAG: TetR/AcrR family transcriptional regulator [Bacilli bacterium]
MAASGLNSGLSSNRFRLGKIEEVGTRIDDIAAAATVSKGLIYHYFGGKETIFNTLVEGASRGTIHLYRQAFDQPGSAAGRLRWLIERVVDGLAEQPDLFMVVMQASVSDAVPRQARDQVSALVLKTKDIMTQFIVRRILATPGPAALESWCRSGFWPALSCLCLTAASSTWRCRTWPQRCTVPWRRCNGSRAAYHLLALGMALTGTAYLAKRFGTKRIYLVSLIGFTVASALCAVSPSCGGRCESTLRNTENERNGDQSKMSPIGIWSPSAIPAIQYSRTPVR